MTKKILSIAAIAILVVCTAMFVSCNKEDEFVNGNYHYQLKAKELECENAVIDQYGRLISKALLNPVFREGLKKAVMIMPLLLMCFFACFFIVFYLYILVI